MARVEPTYHACYDRDLRGLPFKLAPLNLLCCELCGAIVSHTGTHHRWHAGITKLFEKRAAHVTCQQCGSEDTFWDPADGWCCNMCKACDSDG